MTAQPALPALAGAAPCRETRLVVPGISCAGCIAKIERELVRDPAIAAARVRFSGKTVTVSHDPEKDADWLVGRLAALGFDAQPLAESDAAEGSGGETRDLLKRMAVAGFAAMNVMLLSVSIWAGAEDAARSLFHWLSAAIAVPAVIYSGKPFFASALSALTKGRTNMDVPISVGLVLVTAMSLYETAIGGHHAWFDGAVMLLFFLLVGRTLDGVMRARAEDGIRGLLRQRASGAHVMQPGGGTAWRQVSELAPNMVMRVAAGERLAADGIVKTGASDIDASLLTGESDPQPVGEGSAVAAGTLNLTGPLDVKITRAGDADTVAELSALMEAAGQDKSRFVRLADRAARIYSPVVHILAALTFAGWMLAGAGWHQSLLIAIAVLIITCPCALGLAVPAAQVVACGQLMKAGILVKDGSALERIAAADTVFFDKTGTLTEGEPQPEGLGELNAEDRALLLGLAQNSRHPLSRALVRALEAEGVVPAALTEVSEQAGLGLSARHGGQKVELRKPDSGGSGLAALFRREGAPERLIRFRDPLRSDAAETLAALRAQGMTLAVLSGDRAEPVAALADTLRLEAHADLAPGDKLALIETIRAEGRRVLMVGDGLNDGPALAAADASMAPATASDASQQAADIVFLGRRLAPVAETVSASRDTMRVVRQNVVFAILYNALAVPLAMAGLVTPLVAALAMSLSSICVVANSLRLARRAK